MSPRTVPPSYLRLFPWLAEQDQTSQAAFIAEFQDLYSRGMDQALGLQESSFDQAVQMHSQALDLCRNAFWITPMLGDYVKVGTQFLAACMELQMRAVTLMFSGALPAASSAAAQQTADELAMEIASGQRKKPVMGRQMPNAGSHAVV